MALKVLKLLVFLVASWGAQAKVYLCDEGGMRVFRDRPCAGEAPPPGVPRLPTLQIPPVTLALPVFSQVVVLKLPENWQPGREDKQPRSYVAEFIPLDQTLGAWRDMIVVQGFRDLARIPAATPKAFLAKAMEQMQQDCGGDAITQSLGDTRVDSHEAHAAIFGCARAPRDMPHGLKRGKSEIGYHYAIRGDNEIYLIYRLFRGEGVDKNRLPIPAARLDEMFAPLQPIKICGSSETRERCMARAPR
jgi:hypothetical protein